MYRIERSLGKQGFRVIAGADEAGRGPLAGPVVAACVVLPLGVGERIRGLRDSKLLSARRREALFHLIAERSRMGVGVVSRADIDQVNIYQATIMAVHKAFAALGAVPDLLLVDGLLKLRVSCPYKNVIHGDRLSASCAAASIVAKVTRDQLMKNYHRLYPQYEFDRHKGYGTERHLALLDRFGPSPIHRRSFNPVKAMLEEAHAG